MLELNDLSKHFGGVKAVDNVSLRVEKGEILGLIGPNGSGKSTIVNVVFGLYQPDAGEIRLRGELVSFGSSRDAIAAREDGKIVVTTRKGDAGDQNAAFRAIERDVLRRMTLAGHHPPRVVTDRDTVVVAQILELIEFAVDLSALPAMDGLSHGDAMAWTRAAAALAPDCIPWLVGKAMPR